MRALTLSAGTGLLFLTGALGTADASTIADWQFDTDSVVAAPYNSPLPNVGSGSTTTIGMLGGASDDITSIGSPAPGNGNVFRVRGVTNNGWSNTAAQYTQGVEFDASTAGLSNITLSVDWASSSNGILNMEVQYTTNGGTTWNNAALETATTASYTTDTVTFGTGAANSSGFGVRLVSAYNPTLGTYESATGGGAYANNNGNWRFSDVAITGTASPVPVPATAWLLVSGLGGLGFAARTRKRAKRL
jgi:hypothetical protein